MTEQVVAQRWIEIAREQLAKSASGFLSLTHGKIPEIDSLVKEMFTPKYPELNDSAVQDDSGLWYEAENLALDGSFEARWTVLYLMRKFFLGVRLTFANMRLVCRSIDGIEMPPEIADPFKNIPFGDLADMLRDPMSSFRRPIDSYKELRLEMSFYYLFDLPDEIPALLEEAKSNSEAFCNSEQFCAAGECKPEDFAEWIGCIAAQHHFLTAFSPALRANFMHLQEHMDLLLAGMGDTTLFNHGPELEAIGGIESLVWDWGNKWSKFDRQLRLLTVFAMSPELVKNVGPPSMDRLRKAIMSIESIVEASDSAYLTPFLACCYFHLGNVRKAHELMDFFLDPEAMSSLSDPVLTYCLAFDIACLQALGDDEQAIEALHAGLLHLWELPECKASTLFLWDRLAFLRYQAKDFPGAIEALEKSSLISPRSDGWERALLLSAKCNNSNDLSNRFHELNPDTSRGLESTTANQWPRFKTLSEKSRSEWVFGLFAVHFVAHSNLAQSTNYQHHAVSAFALVVEMELRDAVFDRFKHWTLSRKELLEAARAETDPAAKELARFVICNSPLTLGQMSYALSRSGQLRSVVYREFSSWLRLHMQGLVEQVRNLESLVKMRNQVVHDRVSQDGEHAERLAVVILNSIPSVPARK